MKLTPEIIAECRWFIELLASRDCGHLRSVLNFNSALCAGSPVLYRRAEMAWHEAYARADADVLGDHAPLPASKLLRVARLLSALSSTKFDDNSAGHGAVFDLRRSLNMSQAVFAGWLGVAPNTVAQWEKRGTTPNHRYPGAEIFFTCLGSEKMKLTLRPNMIISRFEVKNSERTKGVNSPCPNCGHIQHVEIHDLIECRFQRVRCGLCEYIYKIELDDVVLQCKVMTLYQVK